MDRRHRYRALLGAAAMGAAALWVLVGNNWAQDPSPAATPWVQASPPPGFASASPAKPPTVMVRVDKDGHYFFDKEKDALPADKLAEWLHRLRETQGDTVRMLVRGDPDANYEAITTVLTQATNAGIKNISFSALSGGKPAALTPTSQPTAAVASATPSKEELARAMARKREEELAGQFATPAVRPPRGEAAQLSPDEREAYERNLTLWLALPAAERQALRGQATERIRAETEKAYQNSGLNLNDDQREVFALRYRQERRRLERELQEKATAERARRLPEIMERIKREFGAPAAAVNTPKPTPTATPSATK